MIEPINVFPVPDDSSRCTVLKAGPWMPAESKPMRDGMYLRRFDEGDAFSWWRDGSWQMDSFWNNQSDIQEAEWRGGVLRAGKAFSDWQQKYGEEASNARD